MIRVPIDYTLGRNGCSDEPGSCDWCQFKAERVCMALNEARQPSELHATVSGCVIIRVEGDANGPEWRKAFELAGVGLGEHE